MDQIIYQKMADIMKDVGAVGKDSTNTQQGFKFRGIDAVMNELHGLFAKHGVFILPNVLETVVTEKTTTKGTAMTYQRMKVRFDFVATDGSKISSEVMGEAADSGDKSTSKCLAIALKYCLTQTFLIPTEEEKDPDQHSHEFQKPATRPPEAKKQAQVNEPPAEEPPADAPANEFPERWQDCVIHFGKNKGKKLGELDGKVLSWYHSTWMPQKKTDARFKPSDADQLLMMGLQLWNHEQIEKKGADVPD